MRIGLNTVTQTCHRRSEGAEDHKTGDPCRDGGGSLFSRRVDLYAVPPPDRLSLGAQVRRTVCGHSSAECATSLLPPELASRSEERRVGKECRARVSRYDTKT